MSIIKSYGSGDVVASGFYTKNISKSLRFNEGPNRNTSDSSYLTRTVVTPTHANKWTFSVWIKRSILHAEGSSATLISSSGNEEQLSFSTDVLSYRHVSGGTLRINLATDASFRDTSGWYHVVCAVDHSNSTTDDKAIIYVNGVRQTLSINTIASATYDSTLLTAGNTIRLGYYSGTHFTGYMAEMHFVDGQQLTHTTFGETKNGVWIPKQVAGLTYGNNGFYLNFGNSSAIGEDSAGSNDYTAYNLNDYDIVPDSPTNNFCTMNSNGNGRGNASSFSEGNLKIASTSGAYSFNTSTFRVSKGKWYWEMMANDANAKHCIGISGHESINTTSALGDNSTEEYSYTATGQIRATSASSGHATYGDGDIIGVAMNLDDNQLQFFKDGSSITTISITAPSGTTDGGYGPAYGDFASDNTGTATLNCGQDPSFAGVLHSGGTAVGTETPSEGAGVFKYAPPSGFLALCSANLEEPNIGPNSDTQADDYFGIDLYTGNDGTQTRTTNFKPDWLWIKSRAGDQIHSHFLLDSSRSDGTIYLKSDTTNVEATDTTVISTLNPAGSTGFTLGNSVVSNDDGTTYVAWHWKAGGATPSKTYKVKVVSDSTDFGHGTGSNKYQFFKSDGSTGFGTNGVDLDLQEGGTYTFDWSDSSAQSHPIRFSLTNDGTHSNGTSAGSEYTTGVVKDDSAYKTTITVASGVASLYYYCQNHSGMGAEVRTNASGGQTNFDGSLLSVSQANTDAGFSIVTYTGTGSAGTIGHGLGKKPNHIIFKSRTEEGASWANYVSELGEGKYLALQSTQAENSGTDTTRFNNTEATDKVFSVGNHVSVNTSSSHTYVAYCFAEIENYSKFGSYIGNGDNNGSFVYLGFRPAFIMTKRTAGGTSNWVIQDSVRQTFNPSDAWLRPNDPRNEGDSSPDLDLDFLSNGFKLRNNGTDNNILDSTYIYMAFAESPFKYANAR